ncbi:MAG TPA: hypothetical protein ENJ08_17270 [Gammaproteobacteria bacterium]|nr:hypothetical protein [Gammaproteobacteria bacterium]
MLVIRNEQLKALGRGPLKKYEALLVQYFFKCFSLECNHLGKDKLMCFIRLGIFKASEYGYETQKQVLYFLTIMFILGAYFDEDPLYFWVKEKLIDEHHADLDIRIQTTYSDIINYLEDTLGEGDSKFLRALVRFKKTDIVDLSDFDGSDLEHSLMRDLWHCYPEKYKWHGDKSIYSLVSQQLKIADKYNISSYKGKAILVSIAFMVGNGFIKDPLQSWAGKIFNNEYPCTDDTTVNNLYNAAISQIKLLPQNL